MNAIEERREKDRIRQQRYRNKKKECNVRSIQDNNQQRITKMYEYCVTQMKMEKIMTIMLSVTLFLLLVTLQKNAYDNLNHAYGLYMATICEMSLITLVLIRFERQLAKVISYVTYVLLFLYNISIMVCDIHQSKLTQVDNVTRGNLVIESLVGEIEGLRESLAIAKKKKESGNIRRNSEMISDKSASLRKNYSLAKENRGVLFESAKEICLIASRVILMIMLSLLVHYLSSGYNKNYLEA